MTMILGQETAQIYQFPVKERLATSRRRETPRPTIESPPIIASDFGSGWYHEAAMRDAQNGRTH